MAKTLHFSEALVGDFLARYIVMHYRQAEGKLAKKYLKYKQDLRNILLTYTNNSKSLQSLEGFLTRAATGEEQYNESVFATLLADYFNEVRANIIGLVGTGLDELQYDEMSIEAFGEVLAELQKYDFSK